MRVPLRPPTPAESDEPPTRLRVAEWFGPTFQGEGPFVGTRCAFIRLSGCNLSCSWCDTPYTWDWTGKNGVAYDRAAESTEVSISLLVRTVLDMKVAHVVLTGGEPLIQASGVTELVAALAEEGIATHVETNGTRPPVPGVQQYVVSPKMANSGRHDDRTVRLDLLAEFISLGAVLKFVCSTPADVIDAVELATSLEVPLSRVWIMPEGINSSEVLARQTELVDAVLASGANFSTRLHVLLWEDARAH